MEEGAVMSGNHPMSLAVVGAGDFGHRYVRALSESPRLVLAGVAEQESSRREKVAREFAVPVASTLEGLLDQASPGSIDAVVIATPPTAHLADLEVVVQRGIPALVEKPVVSDVEGLAFLRSLTDQQREIIVPAHLSRHLDQVRVMRRMIEGRKLSLISAWRYVPRERIALHGADHPALSAMIHDFDLVRCITDSEVTSLHVTATRSTSDLLHPDTVVATLTLDNGALVTVGNSWTLPNSSRYVEARFEVVTEENKFVLTTPSDGLVVRDREGDIFPAPELGLFGDGALGGAFERQLDHFAGIVSAAVTPEVTVADAEWSIELALRVANWTEPS